MRIGDTLYYFTTNYMASPPPSSYSGTQKLEQIMLNGSGIRSTEDALQQIARRTSGAGKITMEIDKDARKVKLSAALSSLNWSISTRDGPVDGYVADGSGTPGNGMSAQNPLGTSSVGQIDSGGGANNLPVYSKTATCEYVMSRLGSTLTDTDVTNLQYNTLYVAGNTIQLKDLGFTKGMTSEQVGQKLVSAVNALSNASRGYQAVYEDSTKTLAVTLTNKTNSNAALADYYIYERTVSPSSNRIEDTAHRWTSGSFGIQSKLEPGTGEKGAALEITIPAGSAGPFSVQIGSSTYLFYNSDTHPLTTPGYRYTSYSTYPTNTVNLKNVSNAQQYVLNLVESYARGLPSSQIQSVTRTGNTIRIQAFQGAPLNATVRDGSPITVTPYDYQSGTGVTTSNSFKVGSDDFKQESTISFDISGVSAPTDLVGKGFGVSFSDYAAPYKFQFTDDGSAESGYTAIDISSCASLADVAAAAETVLKRRITSRANQISSVTVDGNDLKINILREGSTSYYITDGEEGIMKEGTITFAGGDDAGHSYKELDFSSINRNNLDSLLGKGFRIHCASCPGEYINVFFCWTNDGTIPPVFDRLDSSTGEIRRIYNIPVELSKIKSGDKIVESIVDQVHPYMNHYTDVMVGDPPSTLLAVERRTGNVTDGAGTLYLGRVVAGIETNFVYSVEDVKVFDEPDVIKPKTHKVKIYVGSGTDYPYIDIHLPHIDPEWLDFIPGTGGSDRPGPT